jgi:hypothetical protein
VITLLWTTLQEGPLKHKMAINCYEEKYLTLLLFHPKQTETQRRVKED